MVHREQAHRDRREQFETQVIETANIMVDQSAAMEPPPQVLEPTEAEYLVNLPPGVDGVLPVAGETHLVEYTTPPPPPAPPPTALKRPHTSGNPRAVNGLFAEGAMGVHSMPTDALRSRKG